MRTVNLNSYRVTIEVGASRIKQVAWYITNLVFFYNSMPIPSFIKTLVLRVFGAQIGKGVRFKQNINIKYPWKLKVGDHSWIGEGVWIDNLEFITIGNHCCLSQAAMLLTGSHDVMKSTFDYSALPITLEDGVWIGAKAIVCPGIICHSHAVLSVGSVAEKDLEAYIIYKGNPAMAVIKRNIFQ